MLLEILPCLNTSLSCPFDQEAFRYLVLHASLYSATSSAANTRYIFI